MPRKPRTRENDNVPLGFTQRCIFQGHSKQISTLAWSPDGDILASGSYDNAIQLWDVEAGQLLPNLTLNSKLIRNLTWSPDGRILATDSGDSTIRLWDIQTGQLLHTLYGNSHEITSLAWSPDGRLLASGTGRRFGFKSNALSFSGFDFEAKYQYEGESILLWDTQTGQLLRTLAENTNLILALAWSPNGRILASGSAYLPNDGSLQLWDVETGQLLRTLTEHSPLIASLAWSPDGKILASGLYNRSIQLWEPSTGQLTKILEGHTECVSDISFSYDSSLLGSRDVNETIRIWRTDTWGVVARLVEKKGGEREWNKGLAFHPKAPVLATLAEKDTSIRIWDLDLDTLLRSEHFTSVHYTTAKIALVGDRFVGKTSLGYRIAENLFRATESTREQHFWIVDKLSKTLLDGTQCEVVLWDFAGQPNSRQIHALFLNDVDLALLVFDPARPDTLAGVDFWLTQLSHSRKLCHTVLVAARTDVSILSTTSTQLEDFCRKRYISGGSVAISAKTNEGVDTLLEVIRQQIDWDAKPITITTDTFKRIKDYVLALKVDTERTNLLITPAKLRALLESTDPNWRFSDAEMMTAVGYLQNHGYVAILRRSSDEQSILLAPEVRINLAASYMSKAQANEKGLGTLEEARALRNEYRFPEVEDLDENERDTLLNAVTELFLDRNICFRESVDNQTFLIFPSLILERPPQLLEEKELVEDMTYVVAGPVENVYPALVVLLGYSPTFQRTNQWRKQAQYETSRGDICGFKQSDNDYGELELVLYYRKNTPDFVRSRFQGLFEEILYARNVTFTRYPPIFCPQCSRQQERRTVMKRLDEGKTFLRCDEDGEKINLPPATGRIALSPESRAGVTHDQSLSRLRTSYETALVRVKGFVRDRQDTALPTCFVSYAWGNSAHERWVSRLADDLRNAEVDVVLDQWNNAEIGKNVARFISRIEESNFILVVGTPSYRKKYENKISQYGSVVAAEVDLINVRLTGTEAQKASILPLLLEGEERTSFPPLLHRRVYADFKQEEWYFVTLFDLVLTILHIPFDDPIVRDLREKLRDEAQALV